MSLDNSVSKGAIASVVIKGLSVSICTAIIVSIILAIILSTTNWLKLGITGLLLVNYLSIAIGGVYAAKNLGSHGWVVGLSVGALYGLLAIVLGGLSGGGESIHSLQYGASGLVAALLVGFAAGMIGVNLK